MKKIIRSLLVIFLILTLLGVVHYFTFPQETSCILIRFSSFNKTGNIYINTDAGIKTDTLVKLKNIAEARNAAFWGSNNIADYKIIYCSNTKEFNKYGLKGAPAVTQLKLGAYIVLQQESLDLDIIAHEISHTILYNNIGWYKTIYKIPTWFNEGLAMQVDERNYYSADILMAKKKIGIKLPDVTLMKNPNDFFSGNIEEVMFNFATARYIVHEWLQTHSLKKFIEIIKKGESFDKAYSSS